MLPCADVSALTEWDTYLSACEVPEPLRITGVSLTAQARTWIAAAELVPAMLGRGRQIPFRRSLRQHTGAIGWLRMPVRSFILRSAQQK